jgi:UDP-N-acetylglucosamine 2-epimerase (non-hydrolysing)
MKIAVAFGTRPEAIKLAPVINELRRRPGFDVQVVLTAQHRELLDQVLPIFDVAADVDLALMRPAQSLSGLTSRVVTAMDDVFDRQQPSLTIVQGDTTSAFGCALASFYRGVPVAHVEAGLRTSTATNPFPEEANRRLTSVLALLHCAPTPRAQQSLIASGVEPSAIEMTGNTIVDALHQILQSLALQTAALPSGVDASRPIVLVTVHRRENWERLPAICGAIRDIAEQHAAAQVVVTVHPNPAVQETLHRELGGTERIVLVPAPDYVAFIKLLSSSCIALTDSGGVQEEAPVLGCPVLVMREETERPEAAEAGVARVVGTDRQALVSAALELLSNDEARNAMRRRVSPFGDGRAAVRIADAIERRRASIDAYAMQLGNPRRANIAPPLLRSVN